MTTLEVLAMIGEILALIGLCAGLPLLVLGAALRASERGWEPTELAVTRAEGRARVRWFAGGDFRERPLRRDEEHLDDGLYRGFVSGRRRGRVRFAAPPKGGGHCWAAGATLTAAGVVGFVVSLLPMFL